MFRKAQKSLSKARICLAGPAGSGKTYSALLIAAGLGGKVAMIDTEHGSGDLYSDKFDYDIHQVHPPFECNKYITAIKEAENCGYNVIIIDSLSHGWSGQGGLLDMKDKIVQAGKGNDWSAWRYVTPLHNQLVETILQSPCHIIATARSKMKYAPEEENGKIKRVRKIGLDPVLREGMEYEFTTVFDISSEHIASSCKDRTSLFDGQFFTPSRETGRKIRAWLESGKPKIESNGKVAFNKTRKSGTEDNTSFLKAITELRQEMSPEIFNSVCQEYQPLEELTNKDKQVELYNKLKDVADFAVTTR
ncbi:MAG: ATP-binding protein [Candidatus Brocadiaceae bacterium]|nr:ATP-binding protein [Candidatus Brocadiaceae bacterium]